MTSDDSPERVPEINEVVFAGVAHCARRRANAIERLRGLPGLWGFRYAFEHGGLRLAATTAEYVSALAAVLWLVWEILDLVLRADPVLYGQRMKLFLLFGSVFVLLWVTLESLRRSRDRRELLALCRDGFRLSNPSLEVGDLATFRTSAEQFRCGICKKRNMPLVLEAKLYPEGNHRRVATQSIAQFYENGIRGDYAAEYLCVIYADQRTKLLDPSTLRDQFGYFARFDRSLNAKDRMTRVFSVPARLAEPTNTFSCLLNQDRREMLFVLLWLNRSVGIETKLHLFRPHAHGGDGSADYDAAFFEAADYVLCRRPTHYEVAERNVLFVAVPGNERECVELRGPICRIFQYEFFSRLSASYNSGHKTDQIWDVTKGNAVELRRVLSVDVARCGVRALRAIAGFSESFPAQGSKLRARWMEFASAAESES